MCGFKLRGYGVINKTVFLVILDGYEPCSNISRKVDCEHKEILYPAELYSRKEKFKLQNLLPGKTYSCFGVVTFEGKNLHSTYPILADTKKVEFRAIPNSFSIDLSVENTDPNWKLLFLYKEVKQAYFMSTAKFELKNLSMLTNYKICLSISDEDCPSKENVCQQCQIITTDEDLPLPPSDLNVKEENKKITVSWKEPKLPSGNIRGYNLTISGEGKAVDEKFCEREKNYTTN